MYVCGGQEAVKAEFTIIMVLKLEQRHERQKNVPLDPDSN